MAGERLLTCVISYNRFHYLRNTVESMLAHFRIGDALVVDDGSDDPRLLDFLDELARNGVRVVRLSRDLTSFHGGLYAAMNAAVELATEEGYEYLQFVQDDMQFVRHDPEILMRVDEIFERHPDAAQVTLAFFKKIVLTMPERVEWIEGGDWFRIRDYGIADTGIVRVPLLREHDFRFGPTEGAGSQHWLERGFHAYALHAPVLAWIPWPAVYSGKQLLGTLQPPPRDYYLAPLDEIAVARLRNLPAGTLAYHEDYCLPWEWSCLSPYWFTRPSAEYLTWLYRSFRRGRPLVPHWVHAGPPAFSVPTVRWLAARAARFVVRTALRPVRSRRARRRQRRSSGGADSTRSRT